MPDAGTQTAPSAEPLFDPARFWSGLARERRDRIGAAAVLLLKASVSLTERNGTERDRLASLQAIDLALVAIRADLVAADPAIFGHPGPSRLDQLGIRQCRHCGCTDQIACLEGCSWSAKDLCSRCASPVLACEAVP